MKTALKKFFGEQSIPVSADDTGIKVEPSVLYAGENRYSFGRNRGADKFRYHNTKNFPGRNRSDQLQNDMRNKRTTLCYQC